MKRILLLAALVALTIGCSSGDEGPERIRIPIEVEPGRDVVGRIAYADGSPAEGVVVSDGYSVTATDSRGVYQLTKNDAARYVFFSYPEDCSIQFNQAGVPDFFRRLNRAATGPQRQDFTLHRSETGVPESFVFLPMGDPQMKTQAHMARFADEIVPDVNGTLDEQTLPCIAVTLGDIGADNAGMFRSIAALFRQMRVAFFHTIGNHDHDGTIPVLAGERPEEYYLRSIASFEEAFCPVNYSFNFGRVHFVVMDDVRYAGNQVYSNDLTDEQIEWLRQDLSYVPRDKMVFVCMHTPVRKDRQFTRRGELLALVSRFAEAHLFVGHTHYSQTYIHTDFGPKIYEHILSGACGMFWHGTVAGDGTPNGYGVYRIDGNRLSDGRYKAARYDAGYQARIYDPSCYEEWAGTDWENYVLANVWCASEEWTVELFEDDVKTKTMERFSDYDRSVREWIVYDLKYDFDYYKKKANLYRAVPNSRTSKKKIRITDHFGNVWWEERITTGRDYTAYR